MRHFIFALAASAFASEVNVVWQHEKTTGSTSLSIHSTKDNELLAEACGSTLGDLDFSRVDEHGAGNFSVGANTFDVASRLQDGVSCTRMYNGIIAMAECSGVNLEVPKGKSKPADCFSDEDAKEDLRSLRKRNVDATAPSPNQRRAPRSDIAALRSRQYGGQCHTDTVTVPKEGGNSFDDYLHKQISEPIDCQAANSCSAGYANSKSFTISWTSAVSADGWVSAGFDVQETWETGNQYTCYGQAYETVCVWYKTAHKAYDVFLHTSNTCLPGTSDSEPFIMKSPKKNNAGGGMYCVIGTCRTQGEEYWGGP